MSRLLVDYAATGARVVRLKSGDPGDLRAAGGRDRGAARGRHSVRDHSRRHLATAAAAAALIPLTRRLTARRVQFVTGHDVAGALPADLNMAALADPLATTVVFMPKRTFPALAARLIAAGLPPDTPCLLAENVSHPDQRLTRDTVAGLAARLAGTRPGAPALILYGPLAEVDDEMS